jgi:hypothetical protein
MERTAASNRRYAFRPRVGRRREPWRGSGHAGARSVLWPGAAEGAASQSTHSARSSASGTGLIVVDRPGSLRGSLQAGPPRRRSWSGRWSGSLSLRSGWGSRRGTPRSRHPTKGWPSRRRGRGRCGRRAGAGRAGRMGIRARRWYGWPGRSARSISSSSNLAPSWQRALPRAAARGSRRGVRGGLQAGRSACQAQRSCHHSCRHEVRLRSANRRRRIVVLACRAPRDHRAAAGRQLDRRQPPRICPR